jgi:hypothetical protein
MGQAVTYQQGDVLQAIQDYRHQVSNAGNLKSNQYQKVRSVREDIVIEPAQQDVVYVPSYDPVAAVQPQPGGHRAGLRREPGINPWIAFGGGAVVGALGAYGALLDLRRRRSRPLLRRRRRLRLRRAHQPLRQLLLQSRSSPAAVRMGAAPAAVSIAPGELEPPAAAPVPSGATGRDGPPGAASRAHDEAGAGRSRRPDMRQEQQLQQQQNRQQRQEMQRQQRQEQQQRQQDRRQQQQQQQQDRRQQQQLQKQQNQQRQQEQRQQRQQQQQQRQQQQRDSASNSSNSASSASRTTASASRSSASNGSSNSSNASNSSATSASNNRSTAADARANAGAA